jgi:peptidoglycan/xylan/chitin deacetylase (PgdA/CDA1 family)
LSDLLVLCYHGVSPTWQAPYAVTPERLMGQVDALLRRGYRPATLRDAVGAPRGARTLVVSFDDALSSVREHALPVLRDLGVPGTVFACSGWVGRDEPMRIGYDRWLGSPDERELVSLGWEDLAVLRDAGWEVGSHSQTHRRLTSLDDSELSEELTGSRQEIEAHLGVDCRSVAYPHGAADDRVVTAAREAGYALACTAQGGLRSSDLLRIPRVVVLREDGPARMRVKTSPVARRLRGSAGLWRLIAPVYAGIGGGRGHRKSA